jgi:hypothetical protein
MNIQTELEAGLRAAGFTLTYLLFLYVIVRILFDKKSRD